MTPQSVINEFSRAPFAFGIADCCTFAGRMVEAFTGENPMRNFDYVGEHEARDVIESFGGLEEAVTATLGEPIPVDESQDGDVLLVQYGNTYKMLGVRCGDSVLYKTSRSVTQKPLTVAVKAWRVRGA